jgi:hypothetical protein
VPCCGKRQPKHCCSVLLPAGRGQLTRMPSNLAATKVSPGSLMASANTWPGTCTANRPPGMLTQRRRRRHPTRSQAPAARYLRLIRRAPRVNSVARGIASRRGWAAVPSLPLRAAARTPLAPRLPRRAAHLEPSPGEHILAQVPGQAARAVLDVEVGAVLLQGAPAPTCSVRAAACCRAGWAPGLHHLCAPAAQAACTDPPSTL